MMFKSKAVGENRSLPKKKKSSIFNELRSSFVLTGNRGYNDMMYCNDT